MFGHMQRYCLVQYYSIVQYDVNNVIVFITSLCVEVFKHTRVLSIIA